MQKILIGLLLQSVILATTVALPAIAQNAGAPSYPPQSEKFKAARTLLLDGHYEAYVRQLEISGAEGDKQCLDELATLYNIGRIVAQDHQKAFEIWQKQAEAKYGPGVYKLATMYLNGFACKKDFAKARALFAQSAALGCDFGTFGLAEMYRKGQGCKTDYAKALSLYNTLCAKHSALGWFGKSRLLWSGLGVKGNAIESVNLLRQAAEAGFIEAHSWLADRYYWGEKIPTNYSLARSWAERGSEQGDVECQLQLAAFRMEGVGAKKDCIGGIDLLKRLANQGIVKAENRLGHAYREGECTKKDLQTAKMWLEKAAIRNYVPAINELAMMYFYGDGVPRNLEKSFQLNMSGASQIDADADARASCQYNVGLAYEYGWGTKKNLVLARIWYEKAAAGGNPHACNNLSLMYLNGTGCKANKDLAMRMRRQGVKNGCWMACINLGKDYEYGRYGVRKDVTEAVRLFKKSLDLRSENPSATYELAKIYEKGLAGKADQKLAEKYYREAAKYGNLAAISRGSYEKTLHFFTPITLPKHRSAQIRYDIAPSTAEFFIHMPQSYTPSQQFGLIVYIDTNDKTTSLPWGWMEVLSKRHFLFICPQGAGNGCDTDKREGLAVLGALEMMKKYNIDKNRVYAAGALGGARIASMLGLNQSDIFRGTIQSCGSNFYRAVQNRFPTTKEKSTDPYGLCEASPSEIADARENVKFVLITGKDDFRRGNVLNIYHEGFAKDGFRAKLIEVESIDRTDCDGKTLEQALDFLQ
ncbi:MAG: SEL1-like repeat protein [Cyanobacteria bacterium SZAS TMP-1]|nr:SEL1-like repeat protein [Cyanobacteria bacterium SZAS TMP-1]